MQRLLTTAILVGLLVATAAAFAVTERLKLTKSPVYGTKVSQRLSPTCGCARGRAVVRFKLRRPDLLTVKVLDRNKQPVRLLVDARPATRGLQAFRWDGRTDAGVIAHDAAYRVEIHLAKGNQSEAIRVFEEYRRLLLLELGLEPTALLAELVAGIRAR